MAESRGFSEQLREEIDPVLQARDATLVHRYLELHRERLAEWLGAMLADLWLVERALAEAVVCRSAGRAARSVPWTDEIPRPVRSQ